MGDVMRDHIVERMNVLIKTAMDLKDSFIKTEKNRKGYFRTGALLGTADNIVDEIHAKLQKYIQSQDDIGPGISN